MLNRIMSKFLDRDVVLLYMPIFFFGAFILFFGLLIILISALGYGRHYAKESAYPGVEKYTHYAMGRLSLVPLRGVEPLKPEFGPVINNVTSFHYSMSVPQCRNNTKKWSIFIAVISAPDYFDKRKTIRNTWKNNFESYNGGLLTLLGFAFIIGQTDSNLTQQMIEDDENSLYGDIIQVDNVYEYYRNLALKVASLLNWLHIYCAQVDFVLKVDDDVYVNEHNLATFIQTYYNRSHCNLYCAQLNNYPPHRDKESKWAISYEEWPYRNFPTFSSGGTVLMPGSTIVPLLAACQTTPMLPFDDVYFLGLCTEKAGIKIQASTSVLTRNMPVIPSACDVRRSITWLTISDIHMNNSHVVTDDFYRNLTQCIVTYANGTQVTINSSEPYNFSFVEGIHWWKDSKNVKRKGKRVARRKKI